MPGPPQPQGVAWRGGHRSRPAIQLAVDYAGKRNTRALVIGRSGHIVFEKYWDGTTLDTSDGSTDHFAPVLGRAAGGFGDERPSSSVNLDEPISGLSAGSRGTPRRHDCCRRAIYACAGFCGSQADLSVGEPRGRSSRCVLASA